MSVQSKWMSLEFISLPSALVAVNCIIYIERLVYVHHLSVTETVVDIRANLNSKHETLNTLKKDL